MSYVKNIITNGKFYLRWMAEKVILCANCGKLFTLHMIYILLAGSTMFSQTIISPRLYVFFQKTDNGVIFMTSLHEQQKSRISKQYISNYFFLISHNSLL